jgi:glycerol uptake facilitator protein
VHGKAVSDWSYAPVPVVGPLLGGVLAGLTLRLLGVQ